MWHAVNKFDEALCYKPQGVALDSPWNFSFTKPSDRTMDLGLTQILTEMSTWNIF